jgi:hypothetical protein
MVPPVATIAVNVCHAEEPMSDPKKTKPQRAANAERPALAVGRRATPCLGRRSSIARTDGHAAFKRADGGYTGPYSGASGYVPAAAPIAPGRFTAPAVPNQPDYTSQMINAIGTGGKGDSKDGGQGLIGGIKMPGGGTLGDATSDALQDFRMDTLGLSAARGGMVRKRGGHVRSKKK